jgi:hypothetical protein
MLYTRGIGLFVGCACAIMVDRHPEATARLGIRSGAAVVTFLRGYGGNLCRSRFTRYLSIEQILPLGVCGFDVVAGTAIVALWCDRDTKIGRVLCIRPLPQIGVISYGMYLYHMLAWAAPSAGFWPASIIGPRSKNMGRS